MSYILSSHDVFVVVFFLGHTEVEARTMMIYDYDKKYNIMNIVYTPYIVIVI